MTIVIACKLLRAVAVIADCRVSYPPPHTEMDDYLQKIYFLGNQLVIGFAGPLDGAHTVMDLIRRNTNSYGKPGVVSNLQRDVERWIRYQYRTLPDRHRRNLSFVLAAVDPSREKPATWRKPDGKGGLEPSTKPDWFPFVPEWSVMTLRPSRSEPGELVKQESGFVLIGPEKTIRDKVEETLMREYGTCFNRPDFQVQIIMNFLKYQLLLEGQDRIGGLFQCALLSEKGLHWVGYSGPDVILKPNQQGRFVQYNVKDQQQVPLMSIWEWAQLRPQPGAFGVFEDPGLVQAVENLRQAEEQQARGFVNE